ncbi:IS3 family transposase [Arthrobacter sp. NPDC080031]|uniref:IS3 family transposase n=1 Tax=Arthrobacter sp. NPDC080031 TaxID=3155918 RepID=UPI00344FBD26
MICQSDDKICHKVAACSKFWREPSHTGEVPAAFPRGQNQRRQPADARKDGDYDVRKLKSAVTEIFAKNRCRYGHPRIRPELAKQGGRSRRRPC